MGYVRKSQTVLPIEHARRLNAALRLELAQLTAENTQLGAKVATMRRDMTVARKKLSRQIRDLDVIRSQTANVAALAEQAASTEPKYGGPDGLQAAADEIAAHEDKRGGLTPVRRTTKDPKHGTRARYEGGCDCAECMGWRRRKSDLERVAKQRRTAARKVDAGGMEQGAVA